MFGNWKRLRLKYVADTKVTFTWILKMSCTSITLNLSNSSSSSASFQFFKLHTSSKRDKTSPTTTFSYQLHNGETLFFLEGGADHLLVDRQNFLFVEGLRSLAFTYGLNKKLFSPPWWDLVATSNSTANWKNFSIW